MKSSLVKVGVLIALMMHGMPLFAATVTWDGGGSSDASGTWETTTNWSTDALPAAADTATLGDVTSGTRTVTITSPETITKLTITQSTSGGINILQLNDNLTLSGNATPFAITATAGQDKIIVNIADNKTLLVSNTVSTTSTFAGTLNLGAGSIFKISAIGTNVDILTPSFGGPINATGAGAQIQFQKTRWVTATTFSGAIHVANSGSTLAIKALSADGTTVDGYNGTVTFSGDDGSGNAVNLDAGTQFSLYGTGTYTFSNRVNLAAGATQMSFTGKKSSSTTTANFNGGLTLGAGATETVSDATSIVNMGGTSTLGSGTTFTIQYSDAQGGANFIVDSGATVSMDNSDLVFDWNGPSNNTNNGSVGRRFVNNGTWTLDNGSTISFISTTGRATSGFGVSQRNINTGTMTVKNGSTVGFQDLYNTGTLNLGSSTAGTSDATVSVGSPADTFGSVTLVNGFTQVYTSAWGSVAGAGTINILGNTFLGRVTGTSGTTFLYNGYDGTNYSTGSVINIGDGSTPITLTVANAAATFINAPSNTVNLKSNATLLIKSNVTGATTTGNTVFTNNGTFIHSGTISMQGNFNGTRTMTSGTGSTYAISGTSATILWPAGNASTSNITTTTQFSISGTLSGSTSSDKLTFDNQSGRVGSNVMTFAFTDGAITPGNGSNGSGTSSVGKLEIVNTNVTFGGATRITMDIGGTSASGLYDTFVLSQTIGSGAVLTLGGTTDTLNIILANGFLPSSTQTYTLITATGGISGTFESLLFNGSALGSEYSLTYYSDHIDLTMVAMIPEPSTYVLMCLGGVMLVGLALLKRKVCI